MALNESNLVFKVGNDDTPGDWHDAPDTASITTGPGEDPDTIRVTIIWDDHAIRNEWLQVTVLAEGLEMAADDIFYFGNAVGEAGNSDFDAQVTTADLLLARNNPRNFQFPAHVEFDYDYDRDGRVNATDVLLARNNQTNFLSRLQLISTPYPPEMAAAAPVPEPSTLALLGMAAAGLLVAARRRRRAG